MAPRFYPRPQQNSIRAGRESWVSLGLGSGLGARSPGVARTTLRLGVRAERSQSTSPTGSPIRPPADRRPSATTSTAAGRPSGSWLRSGISAPRAGPGAERSQSAAVRTKPTRSWPSRVAGVGLQRPLGPFPRARAKPIRGADRSRSSAPSEANPPPSEANPSRRASQSPASSEFRSAPAPGGRQKARDACRGDRNPSVRLRFTAVRLRAGRELARAVSFSTAGDSSPLVGEGEAGAGTAAVAKMVRRLVDPHPNPPPQGGRGPEEGRRRENETTLRAPPPSQPDDGPAPGGPEAPRRSAPGPGAERTRASASGLPRGVTVRDGAGMSDLEPPATGLTKGTRYHRKSAPRRSPNPRRGANPLPPGGDLGPQTDPRPGRDRLIIRSPADA